MKTKEEINVGDKVYYQGYTDVYKATVVAKKNSWFTTRYVIEISPSWHKVVSADRLYKNQI